MPFIAVAEAHVLEGLRQAGVRPARIHPLLARLKRESGREYVLAAPELASVGIDVRWQFARTNEGRGLVVGHASQVVMREIVEDYLRYVIRAEDGYPRALQPRHCEPSKVIMDPARAFGQPVFAGGCVRVADVAGMLGAGESSQVVAEEQGISVDDVRTAARILLGHAAPE